MTETASIYGPVAQDISVVRDRLRRLADGRHPLLAEAISYVFESVGKHIRPTLCLLSGKLGEYDLDALVTLAASIEVVHTATLVHDDTVDQALRRRGVRTVNSVWGQKIAILLGDYLFAQSALLATQLNRIPIMTLLSETVMAMSSGELQQFAASQSREVNEASYLQRIGGKTASLFAMCCQGGAIVSSQEESSVEALRAYGVNLGLAFQIADDVLDIVGEEVVLGKPAGGDLLQGNVTLPVILYSQTVPADSWFWRELETGKKLADVVEAVRSSDAPGLALERAEAYAEAARGALRAFPQSEAREALEELTEYVIRRSR
jgi:geranylgeranyl pyrophosphate synthase